MENRMKKMNVETNLEKKKKHSNWKINSEVASFIKITRILKIKK
jgi:hypothetical protein